MKPTPHVHRLGSDIRSAWHALGRAGLVAPELPTVVFVAVATGAGLGWGLVCGALVLVAVVVSRLARSMSLRTVAGGAAGFAVAAAIATLTGVAANGLITDMAIDLGLAAVLLGSVLARHPLFGLLWTRIHRLPPTTDHATIRGYSLTTAVAGLVLLTRGAALTAVFLAGEPVAWLLAVKVALGPTGTVLVVAACYAAAGLEGPDVRATSTSTSTSTSTDRATPIDKEHHGLPHLRSGLDPCQARR